MVICDSCIDAFTENGLDPEVPINEIPIDMGADITDHICDRQDSGGTIDCDCACLPIVEE